MPKLAFWAKLKKRFTKKKSSQTATAQRQSAESAVARLGTGTAVANTISQATSAIPSVNDALSRIATARTAIAPFQAVVGAIPVASSIFDTLIDILQMAEKVANNRLDRMLLVGSITPSWLKL